MSKKNERTRLIDELIQLRRDHEEAHAFASALANFKTQNFSVAKCAQLRVIAYDLFREYDNHFNDHTGLVGSILDHPQFTHLSISNGKGGKK